MSVTRDQNRLSNDEALDVSKFERHLPSRVTDKNVYPPEVLILPRCSSSRDVDRPPERLRRGRLHQERRRAVIHQLDLHRLAEDVVFRLTDGGSPCTGHWKAQQGEHDGKAGA